MALLYTATVRLIATAGAEAELPARQLRSLFAFADALTATLSTLRQIDTEDGISASRNSHFS